MTTETVDLRRSPRRAVGNVLAVGAAQIGGKLLTLVWTVVAARVLIQRDFGEFSFALSLALIISAVAEWGFDPALVRLASRRPEDRERHYAEAVVWELGVGVLLFAATLAAVLPSRAGSGERIAMTLVFAAVFVDLWSDTARSVAASATLQGRTSVALIVQRLATTALVLPLLLLGGGVAGLAGGMLGGYLVGLAANLVALRSFGVRLRLGTVRWPDLMLFGRISLPIGVSSLILVALARIDTVLLELLRGATEVAAYATAYRLFETVLFVTFAVSSVSFPMMSADSDDPGRVRTIARNAIAAMTVVLVPFAAVCLADAHGVLRLIFGETYAHQSAGALRWLAVAPIAYSVAYVGGTGLIAVGRNRGLVVASAVAALVNVVANLLIIPHWAGTGAAFATTLSYVVEGVVSLVLLHRWVGRVGLAAAAPEALAAGVVLGVLLWAVPAPLLAEVPIGVLLYFGMWFLLARRSRPDQLELLKGLVPGRQAR